jgi:hypothetical protein
LSAIISRRRPVHHVIIDSCRHGANGNKARNKMNE